MRCGCVVLNDLDQILLVRDDKGWGLPKGKKKSGEGLVDAALREVKEETGIDCEIIRFVIQLTHPKGDPVFFWLGFASGGALKPQYSEVDDVRWFDMDEARDVIIEWQRDALDV